MKISCARCSSAVSTRERARRRRDHHHAADGLRRASSTGLSIGLLALGRRADLPVEPGDQLRGRRDGRVSAALLALLVLQVRTGASGPP